VPAICYPRRAASWYAHWIVKLGVAGYLLHHVFTPLEVVVVRPPTMAGPESLVRGSLFRACRLAVVASA